MISDGPNGFQWNNYISRTEIQEIKFLLFVFYSLVAIGVKVFAIYYYSYALNN